MAVPMNYLCMWAQDDDDLSVKPYFEIELFSYTIYQNSWVKQQENHYFTLFHTIKTKRCIINKISFLLMLVFLFYVVKPSQIMCIIIFVRFILNL